MDVDRWQRTKELYHAALDLPDAGRREFLRGACDGDPALLAEVLELIDADAHGPPTMDGALAAMARAVLDGSVPPFRAVGPYRVLDVLGKGGMGVVYLAEREDLGQRVAIKVLRDAALSPARRARFLREERTLARLVHPAIARLYDADVLPDGTPYFVMEYVEGSPITRHCDARRCGVAERLRLLREACEAVQYAHEENVVHRDLKPSNVYVAEGAAGHPAGVKLLDFGIAKQLAALDPAAEHTRTAFRLMTLAYAAPEQVRGDPAGPYTDVYALGMILYELLTGVRPFDRPGLTSGQVEAAILEEEPERPSAAVRRAPAGSPVAANAASLGRAAWADLDVLCLTAIHKDPRRRYRTAQALLRDVDHYLKREPLEARPDTLAYRAGKFLRRRWRPVAAAAVALAVVAGQVAFYTARLAAARDAAVAEAVRAQRLQRFTLSLFAADDGVTHPDSLPAIALLHRGAREARLLDREPLVQAEVHHTLGEMYRDLGDLDRADSLARLALDRRRSLLGPTHPDVARSLVELAIVRADQARFDEAERLVREALAALGRSPHRAGTVAVGARVALGRVLQERGQYDAAIAVLDSAVAQGAALGADSVDPTQALNQLANAHYYNGAFAAADSINRRVLAIDRERLGPRHPSVADALLNLAASRHQQGAYAEAEPLHREALAIFTGYYGADHPETASSQMMLAQTLLMLDRADEAAALVRSAHAVRERVFGPTHPRVATTLNELGNIALRQRDHDAAQEYFRRATDVYRAAYDGRHVFIGVALTNLAGAYAEGGRFALAERAYHEALAEVARAVPAGHLQVGITRGKYGRALLRERRYAEARAQLVAAYENLTAQPTPPELWLRRTLEDLVEVHAALGDPAQAARFREALGRVAARRGQ